MRVVNVRLEEGAVVRLASRRGRHVGSRRGRYNEEGKRLGIWQGRVVVCWWLEGPKLVFAVRLLPGDVGCRCGFGSSGGANQTEQ